MTPLTAALVSEAHRLALQLDQVEPQTRTAATLTG
jgi:hypothetical protein